MNKTDKSIELSMEISNENASLEKIDEIKQHLHTELKNTFAEISVQNVRTTNNAFDNSKPKGDLAAVGAIILSIVPDALPSLITWLKEWLMRDKKNTIKIKKQVGKKMIELEISSDTSINEIQKYLDLISKNL